MSAPWRWRHDQAAGLLGDRRAPLRCLRCKRGGAWRNPAAQCRQWCYHQTRSENSTQRRKSWLIYSCKAMALSITVSIAGRNQPGDLARRFRDGGLLINYLFLSGTTSVSIHSSGEAGGFNELPQLAEANNVLTTVTLKGSELFILGSPSGDSNAGDGVVALPPEPRPTLSHSSLTLIDASATTGGVKIYAGATNTSSDGAFVDGGSLSANVTITYTGLTIKGGSGNDIIENDAKNGIVTDGNAPIQSSWAEPVQSHPGTRCLRCCFRRA